ncbi:hypothetical protein SAMN04488047_101715 [Tranquillimonas alkanivorans]|uniref:HD/PDEase domain-containing protein n=1 Tax=Tranquillimonas alkanivorans TaxID=441119 RepID=A0A1I5LM94_9RHOB|nr:hypothetical protein SAMN04488047_101715 [Tranquillimonas alkanivorans]
MPLPSPLVLLLVGVSKARGFERFPCVIPARGEWRNDLAKPARAWQRMLSGRRLDLLDPTPVDIEIEDIAHGLAFVARWNGQTAGDFAYSVAEHSLLVEHIFGRITPDAPVKWRMAALLHDAPEYVIGDMISPVKAAVGPDYGALDERLTAAIHVRFGLPAQIPATVKKQIKRADRVSAWMEATRIAGFSQGEATKFFGRPKDELMEGLEILLRPPREVRYAFTERHRDLLARM